MNVERIRQVADMIERVGDAHKAGGLDVGYDQLRCLHDCGTPACIAGFTAALAEDKDEHADLSYTDAIAESWLLGIAQSWLDLTIGQAYDLFHGEPFGHDDPPTAEEAAACLRGLADSGGVKWRRLR